MDWKVSFEGGFWNQRGDAGKELKIEKEFIWKDETWKILSAYICNEGIVVDYGVEISLDKLNTFLDKWNLRDGKYEKYTRLEQEMILNEQPLNIEFTSRLVSNGIPLQSNYGCSISWIPAPCCVDEDLHEAEVTEVMEHYGLTNDKAWNIWRCAYNWEIKQDKIDTIEFHFERNPVKYSGRPFKSFEKGSVIEIEHPVSGQKHNVFIQDVIREEHDSSVFGNPDMEFPSHFMYLTYSLDPDLECQHFSLQDLCESDQPRLKKDEKVKAVESAASAVGAIHSLIHAGRSNYKTACSSMHYDTEFEVEWLPVFWMKDREDISIILNL